MIFFARRIHPGSKFTEIRNVKTPNQIGISCPTFSGADAACDSRESICNTKQIPTFYNATYNFLMITLRDNDDMVSHLTEHIEAFIERSLSALLDMFGTAGEVLVEGRSISSFNARSLAEDFRQLLFLFDQASSDFSGLRIQMFHCRPRKG